MSLGFKNSESLNEKAKKFLVGGVNSPVRSFRRVGGHPVLAKEASGAYIIDVDNNKYIDFVMSYGPHLFGHRHPKITSAIQEAASHSFCYGMTTEAEIEWANLFLQRSKFAEKVRAVSTGTEATATCIRLARGITGRDKIIKFSGHYHGHVDSLLVDAGSGVATLSQEAVPECKGIPKVLAALARVLEFNNEEALEKLFQNEGSEIAALILEPVMGNMGVVPPQKSFLEKCRSLCTQYGTLLIFDEVMCGLRIHHFSAPGLYDVKPDLGAYGKIAGGGMPLAALCGSAKYMDALAPLGEVYQAGTLSGNPLSIQAGIAMMKLIDSEKPYEKLEKYTADLTSVFEESAKKYKIKIRIERVASMMSVFFREKNVMNAKDTREINEVQFKVFFWEMLKEGIMLPPSPFEAFFLSTAHLEIPMSVYEEKINRVMKKISEI